MENLLLLLTASLVLYKSPRKFKKTTIGKTGCSVLFSPDATFDFTDTEDGDVLYYSEHSEKHIGYGILCARLTDHLPLTEARDVMHTYISHLQRPFQAPFNTGQQFAEGEQLVSSVTDYWQDENGVDWKVKGYTNGEVIAVLYVKNINDIPVEKQDAFLESFSFSD